jgi:hypothetical protein
MKNEGMKKIIEEEKFPLLQIHIIDVQKQLDLL